MTARWPNSFAGLAALCGLAVVLAAPVPADAQDDSGSDIRFRLRTSVELVLVPVTVKDRGGNLVTDLRREDFQLLENGQEQAVRYFSTDPFPLAAVILVDRALERSAAEGVKATLPVLASALAPSDEFGVYAFDAYPRRVLDFTSDREELLEALTKLAGEDAPPAPPAGSLTSGPLSAGPQVNTVPVGPGVPPAGVQSPKLTKSLHDALFAAALALRTRERGRRRAIFILSDGRNSRLNVHSFEETRALLLAEDVTVYALGVGGARFALGTSVLSDYARATGGEVYAPLKQPALAEAHKRAAEQARYQYTLVYAARPAPASREYRRIQVRVRRAGLTVRAREGYFAGVPEH